MVFVSDVIGQVLDLGDLDTVHCAGGKQRKKLEFTLRDIKYEFFLEDYFITFTMFSYPSKD